MSVQAHLSAGGLPDADEQPHERGLARTRRPDDAHGFAGFETEGDRLEHQGVGARRGVADLVDRELSLRPRKLRGLAGALVGEKRAVQPAVGLARADQAVVGAHQPLDGLQGAGHQDHVHEQQAGGDGVVDDQPSAHRHHDDLDQHPGCPDGDGEHGRPAGRLGVAEDRPFPVLDPLLAQVREHPHAEHGLGVPDRGVGEGLGAETGLGALLDFGAAQPVLEIGHGEQRARAHGGDGRHGRVDDGQGDEEQGDRGQIEQGGEGRAGDRRAQDVHVADDPRLTGRIAAPGALEGGVEDLLGGHLVEHGAEIEQQPAPQIFDDAGDAERAEGGDRQNQEARDALADDHPAIDLHGEDRQGQEQQVAGDAEAECDQQRHACEGQEASEQRRSRSSR